MKKILDIPYYSQYRDVKDEYWKPRACGILCLKMILDFLKIKINGTDDFIQNANEKKAYGENGWIHQGLIDIAKDFDVEMKRKEYKNDENDDLEKGIEKIINSIEDDKPVLVSAIKKFSEKNKFHMVLLVGFEIENNELKGFYYNDPDYENNEGKNLFVDIEIFKKYWRRLVIFVK